MMQFTRRRFIAASALAFGATISSPSFAADPIKIGLVTALSGQSARAGEAITRGMTVAIDEINAKGGVMGRPLELVRRDDEANPAKGVTAARELIFKDKVAILFGGLDTPVSMAIVPVVEPGESSVHGTLGGGHSDHAERRQSQLRVSRFGRRRNRRQGDAAVRDEELQGDASRG